MAERPWRSSYAETEAKAADMDLSLPSLPFPFLVEEVPPPPPQLPGYHPFALISGGVVPPPYAAFEAPDRPIFPGISAQDWRPPSAPAAWVQSNPPAVEGSADSGVEIGEAHRRGGRRMSTGVQNRIAFRTRSEDDVLPDGYKWRKYGKKKVKSSPHLRNYYRCSAVGCGVKKRVERDGGDPTFVITSYDGKHNHRPPAPRAVHAHQPAPRQPAAPLVSSPEWGSSSWTDTLAAAASEPWEPPPRAAHSSS